MAPSNQPRLGRVLLGSADVSAPEETRWLETDEMAE